MTEWGWLAVVVVIDGLILLALYTSGEDRWKRGRAYRCNYVSPTGQRCELDHLHEADYCVTQDKYGGIYEWKGLNWEWDDQEQAMHKRPASWRNLS